MSKSSDIDFESTAEEVISANQDDDPDDDTTNQDVIAADAPSINYSLPDITPYTGRYYVNLTNVVSPEWWKDPPTEEYKNDTEVKLDFSWKPIGGFNGSVIPKGDDFEVEAYPSSSVPLIKLGLTAAPFRIFRVIIASGNLVTTAKKFITIVGTAGTSNPLEWTASLTPNGTSEQLFRVEVTPDNPDIGIVTSVLVKKEAVTAALDSKVILFTRHLEAQELSSEEVRTTNMKRDDIKKLPFTTLGRGKYSVHAEDIEGVENMVRIDNHALGAQVPKGLTALFFDDPTHGSDTSESFQSVVGFGVQNIFQQQKDKASALVIEDSSGDTDDWILTNVVIDGEVFKSNESKIPLKETEISLGKITAIDTSSLIKEFDKSVSIPDAFNQLEEDSLCFYSQRLTATNFTISLDGFSVNLGEKDKGIPPTFGLMVRESLDAGSLYFAILFVSEPQGGYTVRTISRPKSSIKNTDSVQTFQSITTGFQTIPEELGSRTIEIRRQDNDFAGYMGETLIGKINLSNLTNSLNTSLLSRRTILGKVEVGIAVFSPPKYIYRGLPIDNLSTSRVTFTKTPTVVLEPALNNASKINKSFSIIEAINLSTFYGHYGAGRTIKTFTLLPSEETEITISSYKDSTETLTSSQTIFDSFTEESSKEFENTVEQEQSNASQYENTKEAHVEASAGYSGFGASVSISAGASTSETTARQEMARSVMNFVEKHAAKASSQRDVEINTSSERKVEAGSSKTVTRKLVNINKSRTLNFTFRQMNQEFISIFHLVDLRISFVGSREGTYEEEDISKLREFVSTYVKETFVETVVNRIYKKMQYVEDYKEGRREVLTKKTLDETTGKWIKEGGVVVKKSDLDEMQHINPPLTFPSESGESGTNGPSSFISFDKDLKSNLVLGSGLNQRSFGPVKGVILSYGSNVVRTDGILTEAIIGKGEGLDRYNNDLQQSDIAEREAETGIKSARKDLLLLKKDVLGKCSTISFGVFFSHVCITATIQLLYAETTSRWNNWMISLSVSIIILLLIFEYYTTRSEKSDGKIEEDR